jgi:hypothetical protein
LSGSKRYLKWADDVVGVIGADGSVEFLQPRYNTVVSLYTHGTARWPAAEFEAFLAERAVSSGRRDIEKILFRAGLSEYDVMRISEITRGIHPKDLLWIANSEDEKFSSVMTDVFSSVFAKHVDITGGTLDSPEGYNIKRYGVREGKYGIYKQRISPLSTDAESEVAVYLLAERLGVPCCPAYRTDEDTIFSEFRYDFANEYIVHFRRLFDGARSDNEYRNLVEVRPQYKDAIAQMILLDFITRQDDRHLSNIAIKISAKGETFYPLYDNGRSLFYEDSEEMVIKAAKDPKTYATTFGYAGTYYDYVKEIAEEGTDIKSLINLSITDKEIEEILKKANFKSYRQTGAEEWVRGAINLIRTLSEF